VCDPSRVLLWNSSVERQRFESKTTRRRVRPQLKRRLLQRGKVKRLPRARVLLKMHHLTGRPRLRARVLLKMHHLTGRPRLRARVLLEMHRLRVRAQLRARVLLGMRRLRVKLLLERLRLQMQSLVMLQPERVLLKMRLQMRRLMTLRRERGQ